MQIIIRHELVSKHKSVKDCINENGKRKAVDFAEVKELGPGKSAIVRLRR